MNTQRNARKWSVQERVDKGMQALKETKYVKKINGGTMFPKKYDCPWYLLVDEVLSDYISPRFDSVLDKFEHDKK